jgi:hypothetical protein
MKRFGLWLTILLSLPALMLAQATGGSTCSKVKEGGAVKNTGGKKVIHPELARKGASKKAPKKTGTGNAPALESKIGKNYETGTGRKGKVEPTASAQKKPPHPEKAKPPDPK